MFIIIDQEFSPKPTGTTYGRATLVSVVATAEEAAGVIEEMYGLSGRLLTDYFATNDMAPYRTSTADRTTAVSVFQRDLH